MRVYANEECYVMDDENFLMDVEILKILSEKSYTDEGEKLYRYHIKRVSKAVREGLGINNLLGYLSRTDGKVTVLTYDIEATDTNFYKQGFDEEKGQFYMETIGEDDADESMQEV